MEFLIWKEKEKKAQQSKKVKEFVSHTFSCSSKETSSFPVLTSNAFFFYALRKSTSQKSNPIRALETKDLSCSFKIGIKINDDVLLRCRHFKSEAERISMFRVFFHTSFISQNFLRFTKVDFRDFRKLWEKPWQK